MVNTWSGATIITQYWCRRKHLLVGGKALTLRARGGSQAPAEKSGWNFNQMTVAEARSNVHTWIKHPSSKEEQWSNLKHVLTSRVEESEVVNAEIYEAWQLLVARDELWTVNP